MPTINVTPNNIGAGLNKIFGAQLEMFKDSLIHVLQFYFVDDYVAQFSLMYDQLLVAPYEGRMSQNDKTAPSKLKPYVLTYIKQEVSSKVSYLKSNQKVLSINAIANEVFGFPSGPDRNETDPLKLFYFYLVGTPQDFAFVDAEFIDEWRAARNKIEYGTGPSSKNSSGILGRFGMGFMVPLDEYAAVFKVSNSIPPPGQAKHPFSGSPPIHIFEEVRRKINFNLYIEKAVTLMRKT